jgi:cell division protein ZapB
MQGFSNYSASMEADLKALEDKLKQLIVLCQSLREENQELRQDLAQAQDDVKQLKENMLEAGTRLEALLDRLPEESL